MQLSTSRESLTWLFFSGGVVSRAVVTLPAVSWVLGPAAFVRSVSLGTRSGEGALCLGTVPERTLPLRDHDSGWSSWRERGEGGRLPAVTSVPTALTSGLQPKLGTAAWRGEVALWPSKTTQNENYLLLFWDVTVCRVQVVKFHPSSNVVSLRKKLSRGQLRKAKWDNGDPQSLLTVFRSIKTLEDAIHPSSVETSTKHQFLFWKLLTKFSEI